MSCTTCLTIPTGTNGFITCKGTNMNILKINTPINLRPSERKALTKYMSLLLMEFGNLLKAHPEIRTKLSPENGELLIKIGNKLSNLL